MIDRSGRKLLLCFCMVKLCGKAYGLFSGKNSQVGVKENKILNIMKPIGKAVRM